MDWDNDDRFKPSTLLLYCRVDLKGLTVGRGIADWASHAPHHHTAYVTHSTQAVTFLPAYVQRIRLSCSLQHAGLQ